MQNRDQSLPFTILHDTDLIVRVSEGKKDCMCLSNMSCAATQSSGLVELSLDDHILEQVMDKDGL